MCVGCLCVWCVCVGCGVFVWCVGGHLCVWCVCVRGVVVWGVWGVVHLWCWFYLSSVLFCAGRFRCMKTSMINLYPHGQLRTFVSG